MSFIASSPHENPGVGNAPSAPHCSRCGCAGAQSVPTSDGDLLGIMRGGRARGTRLCLCVCVCLRGRADAPEPPPSRAGCSGVKSEATSGGKLLGILRRAARTARGGHISFRPGDLVGSVGSGQNFFNTTQPKNWPLVGLGESFPTVCSASPGARWHSPLGLLLRG